MVKSKEIIWMELFSVDRREIHVLKERSLEDDKDYEEKVAGWILSNEKRFQAFIPGLPTADLLDDSITMESSAIRLGVFDDLKKAKEEVERYVPKEEDWLPLRLLQRT